METIQGNHDRREPILRKIASESFFPNPLSPFRASSYEPGQPGWLGFRDLASPLFPS